ncbi:MAG: hypothetical protein PVF47_17010 [Anaerolineae bacterium]
MRRAWMLLALLLVVALVLPAAAGVLAQGDYDLSWWTADGSGGTGSGGSYTLAGTAGQGDAAAWRGGGYTLLGGFWPGGQPAGATYAVFLPLVMRQW